MDDIHLNCTDYINKGKVCYSLFIAPEISQDTFRWAKFIKYDEGKDICLLNIEDFVKLLERENNLEKIAFSN